MSCAVCNRNNCTSSFHSFEEQDQAGERRQSLSRLALTQRDDAIREGLKLLEERNRLKAALEAIIADPHQSYESRRTEGLTEYGHGYELGVCDGHRCAAKVARAALEMPAVDDQNVVDQRATDVSRTEIGE